MHFTRTIWVVLALSLLGCDSDESIFGGTPTVGAGGATVGAGGQGAGGAGGSAGDACIQCAQARCQDQIGKCMQDPTCQAWAGCIDACNGADGAACAAACNQQYDGAAALYQRVYECTCGQCTDACASYDVCNQKCIDDVALPLLSTPPMYLSETGYFDPTMLGSMTASYLTVFEPRYVLWSDGAVKTRWWYLPKCTQVDTSNMDHWDLPVGTRFWKEFVVNGIRIETRFIHRFGPGPDDWLFAAYMWGTDTGDPQNGGDPVHVPLGVQNAGGTQHDIPSEADCMNCHGKLVERALGFSAIQLSHPDNGNVQLTTMATLSKAGKLSVPHETGYEVPGNDMQKAAIGYLHANCGNCHNATGVPLGMHLRVLTSFTTVESTDTYTTTVGQPVIGAFANNPLCMGCNRITAGSPGTSAVTIRMSQRGNGAQMPPLGTELIHQQGIDIVSAWISSL